MMSLYVSILLPFLIILVASLASGIQHSDAGSKKSQSELEEGSDISETSGPQSQESPDTESEETSDAETNESVTSFEDVASPEQTPNLTSTTSSPRPTTIPTNGTSSKQFSTKNQADVLGGGVLDAPPSPVTPTYNVKVTFDYIRIFKDHEGPFSGDAEMDIVAYVHGKKVSLTDAAPKLWDVKASDLGAPTDIFFKSKPTVTVDLPDTFSLSIFTVGSEVDGCGRTAFPDNIPVAEFKGNSITVREKVKDLQSQLQKAINPDGCSLNKNDILGVINEVYDAYFDGFGAGFNYAPRHYEEHTNTGDYRLGYTIKVTPPQ